MVLHDAPGAREWLLAAGYDGDLRETEDAGRGEESDGAAGWITIGQSGARALEEQRLAWQPQTFKQILARALALGAATGCQAGMMRVIAEGEARLATLRTQLGIDRKAGPEHLAVCDVLLDDGREPPPWTPDLLDRAAGRPPRREIQEKAHIVRLGPDILVPGPHLYHAVLRIARELYPNRI